MNYSVDKILQLHWIIFSLKNALLAWIFIRVSLLANFLKYCLSVSFPLRKRVLYKVYLRLIIFNR